MDLSTIKKIECRDPGDMDSSDDGDEHGSDNYMTEEHKVVDAYIEDEKLFIEVEDGRKFYFIKKSSSDWSRQNGFLIDPDKYDKENTPYRTMIINR
jgi:hypothetical protein